MSTHRHQRLGTVEITDACREIQKTNPDPSSVWVEHEGEPVEVTASLVDPNPLHEGRVGCSNCRFYQAKPSKRPVRVEYLIGRCLHSHQCATAETISALPWNQYATNGNNCPCWRKASMAAIAQDMSREIEQARQRRLAALQEHIACKAAGFAGVDGQGMVVDRRDNPDAMPVAENAALGVPPPTRCHRCRSHRIGWLDKRTGETECLDCSALQPVCEVTYPAPTHNPATR